MDNIGPYITYGDLLLEMVIAGNSKVTSSIITLSAKVSDPSGDIFSFSVAVGEPEPLVGDVVHQGGKTSCIVSFPALDQIQIDTTDEIVNGPADLFHSDTVPKVYGENLIHQSMDFIDERTGQFFNKRSGVYKIEGNNTPLMLFPVPIIEIEKLLINSTKTELQEGEDYDYVAFTGRARPQDDRRNPRIKLNVGRGRNNIYVQSLTSRRFVKGTLTEITGSFGFLEVDGRTPYLIQKAVKLLVMQEINDPIGTSTSATTEAGPLKRLKVDLHEQEFFEAASNKESVKSSESGNEDVDRIIAQYRSPIRLGGSILIRRLNKDDVIKYKR